MKVEGYKNPSQWRPEIRRRLFNLQQISFKEAKDNLFSFVFVREPFQRIVSCYYDKMDQDWSKPGLAYRMTWMRNEIIEKYRGIKAERNKDKPTPEEFVRYIMDSAETLGAYNLDNHLKPFWTSCPLCSVQFDVVGHLEDFDEDSSFIHDKMNLAVIY